MRSVMFGVNYTNAGGQWHRARDHGERVTLAALFRRGALERRARRGDGKSADSAFEYANRLYIDRGIVQR